MIKQKHSLLVAMAAAIVLSSCATSFSVQKRRYTKGYHVSVTHKNNNVQNKHEQSKVAVTTKQNETVNTEIVNAKPEAKTIKTIEFAQIAAQIEKTTSKQQQNAIVTANANQESVTTMKQSFKPVIISKKQTSASGSGDGSMLVALLLWFFLGFLAAHRWYAGKPVGWNLLFILTIGGFGLWWLIDFFLILGGQFS